jgi:hypothetical protein
MTALRFTPDQALAGLGAVAAAGALAWSATPLGTMLWAFAFIVACLGYGDQLARRVGERPSLGSAVVTGLACLIVGSTLLAHAGLLTRGVQFAAVALGLGLCAIARPDRATPMPRSLGMFAAIAGVLLLGTQVTSTAPWLTDGVNHTMEVKRLWDTGRLGALPHQAGGIIVGEAYLGLVSGAGAAGAFDAGLCATLLVLVLAGELATQRDRIALPVFLIMAVPIILNSEPTIAPVARWSGALFHIVAFFALQRALVDRRLGGWIAPSALGLVALRWEFAVLALPYLAAGLLVTRGPIRSRRTIAAVAIGWIVVLGGLGEGLAGGAFRAIALTAAAALSTLLILPLIGTYRWRSALGVLTFAVVSASLAPVFGVVPPSAHSGSAISATWFAAAVGVFALFDSRQLAAPEGERIRLLIAAAALVVFLSTNVLWPNFNQQRRDRLRDRFLDAAVELQFVAANGYDTDQDQVALQLQRRVPPGASIGLCGISAAALDYARNPISDLAWQGDRLLAPLSRATVRGVSYLLLEDIEPPEPPPVPKRRADPWGRARPSRTAPIEAMLEPIAAAGTTRLYRVKP